MWTHMSGMDGFKIIPPKQFVIEMAVHDSAKKPFQSKELKKQTNYKSVK